MRRPALALPPAEEPGPSSTAVVLAEDKQYYPAADEVYGAGTEALVMEEDAQPLEVIAAGGWGADGRRAWCAASAAWCSAAHAICHAARWW